MKSSLIHTEMKENIRKLSLLYEFSCCNGLSNHFLHISLTVGPFLQLHFSPVDIHERNPSSQFFFSITEEAMAKMQVGFEKHSIYGYRSVNSKCCVQFSLLLF